MASKQQPGGDGIHVEVQEAGPVVRELRVEVPAARVRKAFDRAYRDLARRVQVRGFRPGKAPRSVLERLYGPAVAEQIEEQLVASTLGDAVEQAELEPVSEPAIDAEPPHLDGRAFQYTARIEVKPAFELPELSGLPARRPTSDVSDEDVDREIEALRQRNAPVIEEPEGTIVAKDHILRIDFVGRIDGEPFEGGRGRGVELEMGAGRFLPGFEEQLIGARSGDDREVRVTFPDDYGNDALRGREAVFQVHVAEIKRRNVPALDDEFAKDLGEFETLDELRMRIRSDLTEMAERRAREEIRRTLMDALIERTPFEVPPGLVEKQRDRRLGAARRRLEGAVPEDALRAQLEQWKEEWRGSAERDVREMLLLEAVARQEGIAAEDAEVEEHIGRLAEEQGADQRSLRAALEDDTLVEALRGQLVEEKALEFLVSRAKVETTSDT